VTLALDLVELDGKVTPEAIIDEILRQNPDLPIPVPIEGIANLAGIEKIAPLESTGFEGMLVTNSRKTQGAIFYNPNSIPQRRRFTVGHELGHFLLPHHKAALFECSKEDMTRFGKTVNTRVSQEAEANNFSSELLMPKSFLKKRMKALGEPDLSHVETLAKECNTSLEATARRYVGLSDYACAVVYAKDRTVRYAVKNESLFPYYLDVKGNSPLPRDSTSYASGAGLGEWQEIDSSSWLGESRGRRSPDVLLEQTLFQDRGFKVVLLYIENPPEDEESEITC
jgi:Zn-dependent peptidase ImmA (M78 family)